MLTYKGYVGIVKFDEQHEMFCGEIVNTKDQITFQSDSAKKIRQEMEKSIDVHLSFCEKIGREASKLFSGEFIIRTTPEYHGIFAAQARGSDLSLNKWVEKTLLSAAGVPG